MNSGGICHEECKKGYSGMGPICWEPCPSYLVDCGAICTSSSDFCEMVTMTEGKSLNLIDIIYIAEMKDKGECDVRETIETLREVAPILNFGFCESGSKFLN